MCSQAQSGAVRLVTSILSNFQSYQGSEISFFDCLDCLAFLITLITLILWKQRGSQRGSNSLMNPLLLFLPVFACFCLSLPHKRLSIIFQIPSLVCQFILLQARACMRLMLDFFNGLTEKSGNCFEKCIL